jgi:hypothetical protein
MTNSPAPGTPQTKTKAIFAGATSFAAAFIGYWILDTDPFTLKEAGEGLLIAATAAGVIGGGTAAIPNKPV